MAHWSTDPEPSRSVVAILRALASAGHETVLVSASGTRAPLGRVCSWAPSRPALPESTTILRRVNVGYDFGSWAAVLASFPGIRVADRVLLVNDSVIGPLTPLDPVMADFESCPEPIWGLVGSNQHRPHLQSFFVGYSGGVLDRPELRAFWYDIRVERRKSKVVRYNELGLAEVLDETGIGWRAFFEPEPWRTANPTLVGPGSLRERAMPFVKANDPAWAGSTDAEAIRGWFPPHGTGRGTGGLSSIERLRFGADIEGAAGVLRGGLRPRRHGATAGR
jgi:hypothetical protein